MINNLVFLIKIVRVFKKYDILKLIIRSVKFKFLFLVFTEIISFGVNSLKDKSNSSDGTRIAKGSFTSWIMNPKNSYFKKNLNGQKIDSIKIWNCFSLDWSFNWHMARSGVKLMLFISNL